MGAISSPHDVDTSVAVVRVATAADRSAVRDVLGAAYRQYEDMLSPDLYSAYLADLLDLEARADVAELLVAEVAGEVVGTVTFYPDAAAEGFGWPPGWAGVRAVAIDPRHRGAGIGRLLVEACVDLAAGAGSSVLCLHTAAFMAAAVRLYERLGFTRAPAFDLQAEDMMGVVDPDGPLAIAYQRPLTG